MRHIFRSGTLLAGSAVLLSAMVHGPAARAAAAEAATLGPALREAAGLSHGLCCVVGGEDVGLPIALARDSDLLVHVWHPSEETVARIHKAAADAGLSARSLVAEAGPPGKLPHADGIVDLVIIANPSPAVLKQLTHAEVLRTLRPQGKAIIGRSPALAGAEGAASDEGIDKWCKGAVGVDPRPLPGLNGRWLCIEKPIPAGIDDWGHWEHGPDNNPVSGDEVIKAPYMTQWLAKPYYIAMPAISTAAGGRVFIAMGHIAHHEREEPWLNTLLARNGYNGTLLWTCKLPDGYLSHRSAFIATDDVFYMISAEGNGVVMLNPETGDEIGRVRIPGLRGDWKWIVLQNDVLYALIGDKKDPPETTVVRSERTHWSWGELSKGYYEKRVPWGFGKKLLAYDMKRQSVLWEHNEETAIDSRAMTMGEGRIYYYAPDSRLGCLDARTGKPVWTSEDAHVRELIEQPGQGLTSTPGFRSTCYALYTPKAIYYEAQTRMNVVAVSKDDGKLLWHRRKTTNNPNMLYLDDSLLVGIGDDGSTLVVDPLTGNAKEDLGFKKRSCTRLTAVSDSLFCRGWPEGLTRYDRINRKVVFNGAFRPSCNDGVVPANGLLYAGPWACDCNLTLMGQLALCSAGSFDFSSDLTDKARLQVAAAGLSPAAALEASEKDWTTYRANNKRTAGTAAAVGRDVRRIWVFTPSEQNLPTQATTAGGMVFTCGDDGKVRALDARTGDLAWSHATAGPVIQAPTIWQGRVYVGSGDGYAYAFDARNGSLLWRFRAAPHERRIMMYGALCSTWPVNSGVIVQDGVAYVAAGLIDYDGTYVYALDAVSGKPIWQNDSSGHLDEDLRKGVSAQGSLAIADGKLWMPGGNVISPAGYDLKTGAYHGPSAGNGSPKANRGEEIGVFRDRYIMLGGRLRYSATENTVNPGAFVAQDTQGDPTRPVQKHIAGGKIPPAWDDERIVMVDGRSRPPVCQEAGVVEEFIRQNDQRKLPQPKWQAAGPGDSDTVSLVLADDAVLSVCELNQPHWLTKRWDLCATNPDTGDVLWQQALPGPALAGGLSVDRDGRILVALADGRIACYGGGKVLREYVSSITDPDHIARVGKDAVVRELVSLVKSKPGPRMRELLQDRLKSLGFDMLGDIKKAGYLVEWRLIGPVPWKATPADTDRTWVGEPGVDLNQVCKVDGRELKWTAYQPDGTTGIVDLIPVIGNVEYAAAYAYAEFDLDRDQDVTVRIGSDDGYKCWLNGQVIGRSDALRGYVPDADVLPGRATKGVNKLLVKVTNGSLAWAFSARVTDAQGKPIDLSAK